MPADEQRTLSATAQWLAVLVVIAWLGMILWLAVERDTTEPIWARQMFLLASMEAVAFGAAGALFGTQIQRQRVENAEERAGKAEKEADESRREASTFRDTATKGKALAAAVKAEAARDAGRMLSGRLGGGEDVKDQQSALSASLAIANELFPD